MRWKGNGISALATGRTNEAKGLFRGPFSHTKTDMFDIKENLKNLPETPGVYLHKDRLGNVIYVGKAINLKRRVSSYFVNSASHSAKVRSMVHQIAEFEYINCKSEMEALILECNLIKKYAPKYNVLLRDDKTYPYIRITLSE